MKQGQRGKWSWSAVSTLKTFILTNHIVTVNDCWELDRSIQKYSSLNVDGIPTGLHVIVAVIFLGMCRSNSKNPIYRTCENTECFNPDHITLNHPRLYKSQKSEKYIHEKCIKCGVNDAEWKSKLRYCAACKLVRKRMIGKETMRRARLDPIKRAEYNESARAYRMRYPERIKEVSKRSYEKFGPYRLYGLTRDAVHAMSENQNAMCAICGEIKQLTVDHDHVTNKVRGLLCGSCNRGIGLFHESVDSLNKAIQYLIMHKGDIREQSRN